MTKEHEESEHVSEQLKELHKKNDEKIQLIKGKVNMEVPCYNTIYDEDTKQFVLEKGSNNRVQDLIESWKVDKNQQLPQDPDPDKLLYGEQKELMNMTCATFDDLIRLNNQYSVGLKYTNLLRENAAVAFGNKFKKNLEIVSQILSDLENSFTNPKTEEELTLLINEINSRISRLNSFSNVNSTPTATLQCSLITPAMSSHLRKLFPATNLTRFKLLHDGAFSNASCKQLISGKGNLLILLKVTGNDIVFGCWIEDNYRIDGGHWVKGSANNFIFSFGPQGTQPVKYFYSCTGKGFYNGAGCGLHLTDIVLRSNKVSYTKSVYTKTAPGFPDAQGSFPTGQLEKWVIFHPQ